MPVKLLKFGNHNVRLHYKFLLGGGGVLVPPYSRHRFGSAKNNLISYFTALIVNLNTDIIKFYNKNVLSFPMDCNTVVCFFFRFLFTPVLKMYTLKGIKLIIIICFDRPAEFCFITLIRDKDYIYI